MSTAQTIAITHSDAYIILTYSASGEVHYIPTDSLTIKHKPSTQNQRGDFVYLNWPSGNYQHALGHVKLTYGEISSPTLANNTALIAYLQSLVGEPGDNGKILVDDAVVHTDNVRGIEIRSDLTKIATWTDEAANDLVAALNLTNKNLMIADGDIIIPGGKRNASIILSQGSIWLLK